MPFLVYHGDDRFGEDGRVRLVILLRLRLLHVYGQQTVRSLSHVSLIVSTRENDSRSQAASDYLNHPHIAPRTKTTGGGAG